MMADLLTTEGLRRALAAEFQAAVEAGVGLTLSTAERTAPAGPGWMVEIVASGLLDGRLTAWIDEAGVQALARAMTRLDEPAEPAIAGGMLREFFAQAVAATAARDAFEGVALGVDTPVRADGPGGAALALLLDTTAVALLVVTGEVTRRPDTAAATPSGARPYPANLAALLDVDLPLVVRFARTEMSLRALAQLGPGSMVDMGRSPDAPVQLLIGSQVIAEGEVVVVGGNYGVRITSLVSPADRLRAMDL